MASFLGLMKSVAARAKGHYGQCPPPKNKSKEKTVQLSYNSEKNVKFDILAYCTILLTCASYVRIYKIMPFSGQTRYCPWNLLPDMRNSKDQKPNAE